MNVELGSYGIWMRTAELTPELAKEVEGLGYGSLWAGGSPPGDLAAIEALLAATTGLSVATGIVNMWRDPAPTVAASYHRIQERHPDRFLLGVGISHPESIAGYDSPYQTMVGYLGDLAEAGVPREHIILAALGPRSLRLSAEATAGSHPYFTSPRHTSYARGIVGQDVVLAPEQTVVMETKIDKAREIARRFTSRYLRLVNYRNSLLREGWTEDDMDDGGSDTLVDAIVLSGESERVAEGIRAHLEAGADNVNIQVLGDDPVSGWRALAEELFG
ncbi:MAG TPA: TIGR03620 family F420-dependent LLM class oxidoreductase [Acidimicrobiia bacterium]|nr:TIGR03620 family F420-dependent LLM class oxidoreductase [Acidimicrobiia bacterium]